MSNRPPRQPITAHEALVLEALRTHGTATLAALQERTGLTYPDWQAVPTPSKDIRTERLTSFGEHYDAFADGILPLYFLGQVEGGINRNARAPRDALGLGIGVGIGIDGCGKPDAGRLRGIRLQRGGNGGVVEVGHLRAILRFQ